MERIVRAALAQLERCAPGDHRVLIVDDASPDGTGRARRRARRRAARGRGAASARASRASAAPTWPASSARWPGGAELRDRDGRRLLPRSRPPPGAAGGQRRTATSCSARATSPGGQIIDWPPLRRLLSRAGSLYARAILGVHVRDLTGGFRCIRREVLEAVELPTLRSQGYVFNIELTFRALRAGFRVAEVPIVFHDRTVGREQDLAARSRSRRCGWSRSCASRGWRGSGRPGGRDWPIPPGRRIRRRRGGSRTGRRTPLSTASLRPDDRAARSADAASPAATP